MKILILGHYEIASNYAISMVVNELLHHELSIALSGKGDAFEEGGNEFTKLAQYEQHLCDELNAGRDSLNLGCDGFDLLAEKLGNPIFIIDKPNSNDGSAKIRALKPDLIISIRYRKILKEKVISIPKFGIINLHSGRLPTYRGAMATFWSMLNGESHIGSTLHFISDAGIDTGDIVNSSIIACDYSQSYLHNVLAIYPQGSQNIVKAVRSLELNGSINSYPQPIEGTYYSFPTETNRKEYLSLGHILFSF